MAVSAEDRTHGSNDTPVLPGETECSQIFEALDEGQRSVDRIAASVFGVMNAEGKQPVTFETFGRLYLFASVARGIVEGTLEALARIELCLENVALMADNGGEQANMPTFDVHGREWASHEAYLRETMGEEGFAALQRINT